MYREPLRNEHLSFHFLDGTISHAEKMHDSRELCFVPFPSAIFDGMEMAARRI